MEYKYCWGKQTNKRSTKTIRGRKKEINIENFVETTVSPITTSNWQGPPGMQGIPGSPGNPGLAGRDGERGPEGERGEEGLPVHFASSHFYLFLFQRHDLFRPLTRFWTYRSM